MSKKQSPPTFLTEAIGVLREYEAELTAFIAMPKRSPFTPRDKEEAQERLRALKDRFKADRGKYEDLVRRDLSDAALNTLESTLHQASTYLRVKTNANPKTSPDWVGDLYSASVDISWALGQLEQMAAAIE